MISEDVRSKRRSYGFRLRDEPFELGNSQGILVRDDGSYVGVADARRIGGVGGRSDSVALVAAPR